MIKEKNKKLNKLDVSLINNHSINEVLLNINVIENRAKSVSLDFIMEYDDEEFDLYFYDLIAYIICCNKGETSKNIDRDIINLVKQLSFSEDANDYISMNKQDYKELINKLTYGTITPKLKDMLINLYIYNEAYIENEFLMNIGSMSYDKEKQKNKALLIAKLNIMKEILTLSLSKTNKIIIVNKNSKAHKNFSITEIKKVAQVKTNQSYKDIFKTNKKNKKTNQHIEIKTRKR